MFMYVNSTVEGQNWLKLNTQVNFNLKLNLNLNAKIYTKNSTDYLKMWHESIFLFYLILYFFTVVSTHLFNLFFIYFSFFNSMC